MAFLHCKQEFDNLNKDIYEYVAFLPEHLTLNKVVYLLNNAKTQKSEQFYKWQFLYSLINSGLYSKDYIGTEIHLPKGNKDSKHIKIDACIFDDITWFSKYKNYHNNNDLNDLEWIKQHIIAIIEFKKNDSKDIQEIYEKQVKTYLKESERDFCLGIYYDTEKLFLFKKEKGKFLRYAEEFNSLADNSKTKDLNLHLTDPYNYIPNFNDLLSQTQPKQLQEKRTIKDLDAISGIHSTQISNAMYKILETMDKVSLVNQKGYSILIQILAIKIFDEKRANKNNSYLQFYITQEEENYEKISDKIFKNFIERIKEIINDASGNYRRILKDKELDFHNENHIKVLISVVKELQNYSFVKSHKTDLYQLIFNNFASHFVKGENGQFLTPIPVIDFLVKIVNPRNNETIIDPTVGIADFLSVSYVNSNSQLDDNNIFGVDIDPQMISLATLNMLLNGDGNAKIEQKSDLGSILYKFDKENDMIELDPNTNQNGEWDRRDDNKELKKFDVVLTNPPFGQGRAFYPRNEKERKIIECYETWNLYTKTNNNKRQKGKKVNELDLGVLFLENAYRILNKNGRLGIVLSNSIASIDTHIKVREWLMKKMRIVALFDLPSNTFAETGVNVTIIVAYKPTENRLAELRQSNYQIFIKTIENLGYEVITKAKNKTFVPIYKINPNNFEIEIDENGKAKIDEDFTQTIFEFKKWCLSQEEDLQNIFIK
ncbi:HsdM family class I SAM-dependent methyltransferase [Campylobacter sp. MG1]|uniref:HsdM family class I SAM-dependent methyltransferase n=1 Tax=Campylobacter sp. MG1 TaxID=2976332 RepID=UPI00226D23F6|nr:N-6 DNA methylase [Campylobacter sp. MG1]